MLLVCLFLLTCILFYVWYRVTYSYWSRRNVKGPVPYPFLGTVGHLFFKDAIELEKENLEKYGNIYGEYVGTQPTLTIGEPKLIKLITVSEFSTFPIVMKLTGIPDEMRTIVSFAPAEQWKRLRTTLSPAFASGKLKRVFEDFRNPMQNFLDNVDELIAQGKCDQVGIKNLSKGFAFDSISKYVVSVDINSYKDPNDPLVRTIINLMQINPLAFFMGAVLPEWCGFLLKPFYIDRPCAHKFKALLMKLINERRQNPSVQYRDFLQALLDSNDNLTDDEIYGHVMVFYFGGIDTVSSALAIILADVAYFQDVQEKLYQELVSNVKEGEEPTYDQIANLPMLNAVMYESLRITPVANNLMRESTKKFTIPGYNIELDKSSAIRLNIYNAHHDPDYYPDSKEFRPERFMGEDGKDLVRNAWFPFGDGPRGCVGIRLGQMKIKYMLYHLVRNYKMKLSPCSEWPLHYKGSLIVVIPDTLRIEFNKRK